MHYIVFLQGGFVVTGQIVSFGGEKDLDGRVTNMQIANAHCIRDWGTTNGAGELVKGPTKSTKLDLYPTDPDCPTELYTVPFHAIIFWFKVADKAWKPVLDASVKKGV